MCIAIPSYRSKNKSGYGLGIIASSPLILLSLGALAQIVVLSVYLLLYAESSLAGESPFSQYALLYLLFYSILPALIFAVLMQYYAKCTGSSSGQIEYRHYALVFLLSNINGLLLIFFYIWNQALFVIPMLFHTGTYFYAYVPIRWIGFWANNKYRIYIRSIDYYMNTFLLSSLLFIPAYYYQIEVLSWLALCFAAALLLIPIFTVLLKRVK